MSTRSYIVIEKEKENGERYYEGIYAHGDGYPSHNGEILFTNYQERAKVEKLISLGDLSKLDKEIETTDPSHSFDTPVKGVTIFYGRDRGEREVGPREVDLEKLNTDIFIEYVYIYTLENEWMCFAQSHIDRKTKLKDVLENEDILYYN